MRFASLATNLWEKRIWPTILFMTRVSLHYVSVSTFFLCFLCVDAPQKMKFFLFEMIKHFRMYWLWTAKRSRATRKKNVTFVVNSGQSNRLWITHLSLNRRLQAKTQNTNMHAKTNATNPCNYNLNILFNDLTTVGETYACAHITSTECLCMLNSVQQTFYQEILLVRLFMLFRHCCRCNTIYSSQCDQCRQNIIIFVSHSFCVLMCLLHSISRRVKYEY